MKEKNLRCESDFMVHLFSNYHLYINQEIGSFISYKYHDYYLNLHLKNKTIHERLLTISCVFCIVVSKEAPIEKLVFMCFLRVI